MSSPSPSPSSSLRAPADRYRSNWRPSYRSRLAQSTRKWFWQIAEVLFPLRPSNAKLIAESAGAPRIAPAHPATSRDWLDDDTLGLFRGNPTPHHNAAPASDDREPLLIQLLFASKELAETQIETAERPFAIGPVVVRNCLCRECGLRTNGVRPGGRGAHMPSCRTGRVLDLIAALEKLSLESNPVEHAAGMAARR